MGRIHNLGYDVPMTSKTKDAIRSALFEAAFVMLGIYDETLASLETRGLAGHTE